MNGVIEPMVNVKPVQLGKNVRMSFSRIDEVLDMPNLIEVQKNSYQWFLDEGLKEVFKDVSGITDYTGQPGPRFCGLQTGSTSRTIAWKSARSATPPMRLHSG